MNPSKKKIYKTGLASFVICFIIFALIMAGQFFYIYYAELVNKNIPSADIALLLFYMAGTVAHFIIPLALLCSTAIFYRILFRKYKISLSKALRKSWPTSLALSTVTFIYSAFIVPDINIQALSSLYEMRQKTPKESIEHVDKSLFKGAMQTMTLPEQLNYIDSLKGKGKLFKERLLTAAVSAPDTKEKYEILNDSVLKKLDINPGKIAWSKEYAESSYEANAIIEIYTHELFLIMRQIESCRAYIVTHIKHPLFAIITFYIGLLCGVLSRRIHMLFLIFGINWGVAGVIYVGDRYLEFFLTERGIGAYAASLLPFLFQFLLIAILFRAAKSSLRNWQKKPALIPHLRQ